MCPLASAASALVVHGTKILFVRSVRTKQKWAFPGGKSENGETAEETATREVMEEVGLTIELGRELGRYVTGPGGFQITCFVATAQAADMEVDTEEILEARWCSLEEGSRLDLMPSVREALQNYSLLAGR